MENDKLLENINEINESVNEIKEEENKIESITEEIESDEVNDMMNKLSESLPKPEEVKEEKIEEEEVIDTSINPNEFRNPEDDGIDRELVDYFDPAYELENNDIKPDLKSNPDYDKMEFDEEGNLVSFINKVEIKAKPAVDEFKFDDPKLKNIFFGRTDIKLKHEETEEKKISLLDALDVITKSGEYVDTYLPMSNIVIRTYEFENDIVMGTTLGSITQDYDFKNSVNPNAILSKRFIDKIVEYSEILSSDSRRMTEDDLEKISNKDVELLILNVAKLLSIDYTKDDDKKDEPVTAEITMECPVCGNRNKLVIDFDKLLKANYTKEIIQYANDNLKLGETIESNLSRGNTMKARGCRYVAKDALGKDKDLMVLVKLKDPSYTKALLIENRILPFILEKYERNPFFSELVNNNNYLSSPMRGKLTLMFRHVQSQLRFADINDSYSISVDFSQDLDKIYLISYIDSIMSVMCKKGSEPKPTDRTDILAKLKEENTLEHPTLVEENIKSIYNTLNKLPKDLLTKLQEKINEMEKESIFKFNIDYKCALTKCGHEGQKEVLPIDLVFSILQRLSEK